MDLGDKFINKILELLIKDKLIVIIHKEIVMLIVNIILLDGENIIGYKFNKLIIIIELIILLNIILLDFFEINTNKNFNIFIFQKFILIIRMNRIRKKFIGKYFILGSKIENIFIKIFLF